MILEYTALISRKLKCAPTTNDFNNIFILVYRLQKITEKNFPLAIATDGAFPGCEMGHITNIHLVLTL